MKKLLLSFLPFITLSCFAHPHFQVGFRVGMPQPRLVARKAIIMTRQVRPVIIRRIIRKKPIVRRVIAIRHIYRKNHPVKHHHPHHQVKNQKRISSSTPTTPGNNELGLAKKALEYTNQYRRKKGLRSLTWDSGLAVRAMKHSKNMGNGHVPFSHQGFDKTDRLKGLNFRGAGENLYWCSGFAGDLARLAVDGWIKSAGHEKNLVGDFTHCGIAVYKNNKGQWYFTQIFARY